MEKAKKDEVNESVSCPIGRIFSTLERAVQKKSEFREHLSRSRIEFLRAVKCLIDEKIEHLEKQDVQGSKKKATRIQVE